MVTELFFDRMTVNGWRQFQSVDLSLKGSATIITGTNGSGKTTLLTMLSKHFGWNLPIVSTPFYSKKSARRAYSDFLANPEFLEFSESPEEQKRVGEITYSNGRTCTLSAQAYVNANYQLHCSSLMPLKGLYIPSHRPQANYNPVAQIPTDPVASSQMYQQYQNVLMQTYSGSRGGAENPGAVQKKSLISLALFGEGNSSVRGNLDYKRIFENFQERLRIVLPKTVGFKRLEVRMPEIVLVTSSGDFSIDAMSGGINAIFGIVWQIFMYSPNEELFTVIMDEPENHLHPTMQRTLLPGLAQAFPKVKFIVATHSPFITSSFRHANVYALWHNENHRVESTELNADDLSGTPNQILRDILDVESNLPVWVEELLQSASADVSRVPIEDRPRAMLERLRELGILESFSESKAR